jgi:callose synthase
MTSKSDHVDKRNYDDFNEFFWSPICLNYHYSLQREPDPYMNVQGKRTRSSFSVTQSLPFIAEGLSQCPKTFLEKRAWLRAVLALHRLIEWHIVTFYLLGVISFSRELVFGWVVSIQLASGVFWICNALHTFWNILEVWASYPGILQTGTSVCGVTFILIARYSILVFQTLFLLWTFSSQPKFMTGSQADSRFWWWQYIWLSIFCMSPYFVELICQIWPALSSKLLKNQNYYIQSFLNLFYPISRLYIAKDVHESLSHSSVYSFFWVTLITWKLFFSYIFEVYPMVLPTLQLTDDYLNNRNHSLWTMLLLLSMRWLPQFLVYLIDMSIWYAAWQAFSGTAVGFADHLGDVRNIDDIRKNFCRAPENFCQKLLSSDAGSRRGSSASFLGGHSSQSFGDEGTSLLGSDPHKLQPYVNRLLDVRIQKWVMFSAAWNEIIDHFRDEDIISNSESDNLKFSTFDGFSQAVYLPVFQTAGFLDNLMAELERPQDEYEDLKTGKVTDDVYFKPIIEDTIMLTAVSEMWELGSYIFTHMLGPIHAQDVSSIMGTILKWSEKGTLSSNLKCENFRSVMESFVSMIKILSNSLGKRKAASSSSSLEKSRNLHANTAIRRSISAGSLVVETENVLNSETLKEFQAYENNKVSTPDALRDMVRDKFRSMVYALKSQIKNTGSNSECQDVMDRLTFLLCMENGFLWDNAYASEQLDLISRNVTYKAVLKKICCLVACHPDEVEPKSNEARRRLTYFINTLFMDIPKAPSLHDMFSWNVLTPYYAEDVTYGKDDLETRSDALGVSTLLYLKTLYRSDWNNFLERMGIVDEETIWSDHYMDETRRWASIRAQTLSRTVNGMMYYEKALRFLGNLERLDNDTTDELVGEKFGYIVSCQVYGNMKRNQDPKATDIDNLMHRFPLMRVAYIDSIRVNRSSASVYYSVLVKSNGKGVIQEVYRIRLPGDPIIGEGKPENQNHAMIFTRGEFLQTIDMNQEGYFEEALKMRNCLQEFAKREGPLPTTILGLREHIFTGSVSSLANYMALQETSFVTMGQRVLTRPLCIRLHYGHPDVFDKIFFITRGGISKSSKGINLSEDIFAGYNNVLRGGSVSFKEYLQVGKGRDVGMSQIYKFEAKLSQGAAEQIISRDVYRMCHRLDFFRLLSFYYGGIGHYISNVLTISTIIVVVNLMTLLAIFDRERVGERLITPMGTIQMMLGGLGLLQTIPLFATLGVERGWWNSIQEIFYVFVTGGPLHFMFHIQTKATYMVQTILVGGAKYRPTGRGFVTQHTPFDEQYRFFASSHLYLGVELAVGLILIGIYTDAGQYPGRTWSLWLASLSFLASPFWFNPLTFDWNVVMSDYELWLRWLRCSTGGATKSWAMWWIEENSFYKSISLPSTVFYLIKAALLVFIGEGIRQSDLFSADTTLNKPIIGVGKVLLFVVSLYLLNRTFGTAEHNIPYPIRRTVGIISFTGIIAGFVTIFIEDTNYIRYALVSYFFLGALSMVGLISGFRIVKNIYFVHDIVCGHIIFIPLFILAALRLPHYIQTWLLYHNALSSDVVVSDILRYARRNQQSGRSNAESSHDLSEEVAELKQIIQRQEQMLFLSSSDSSNQPSTLNSPTASIFPGRPFQSEKISVYARTQSMPGFDVPLHTLEDKSQVQNPKNSRGNDFLFSQPDMMPPR